MYPGDKINAKEKSVCRVAVETFKDYAEHTGIHGIKYTVRHICKYEKMIWTISVLFGLLGAAYMTFLFWVRFTSNPTRTSTATDYAPLSSIPFPAITICNSNRILPSKVEEFVDKLQFENDEEVLLVKKTLPQLLAYLTPNAVTYNATDLLNLQTILDRSGFSDILTVMALLSQTCGELIMKCSWNIMGEDCKPMFKATTTADGHCCSFNYYTSSSKRFQPKYTIYSGFQNGLTLVLDPSNENVQYSSLHSAGIKVFVHTFTTFPDTNTFTKLVSVGKQTFLHILGSKLICSPDVQRLSVEQRKCLYPSEGSLKYFDEYDKSNCLTECIIEGYERRCGCVPFYFAFTDKEICNISKVPCLDASRTDKTFNPVRDCSCPSQCELTFYDTMSTSTDFAYIPNLTTSSFLVDQSRKITEDTILLNIYFGRPTHTILLRDTITSSIYLLASFGGVYSLFMGCSVISLVELVYYIFVRFIIKLKVLTKLDPYEQENMSPEDKNVFKQRKIPHNLKGGPIKVIYNDHTFYN